MFMSCRCWCVSVCVSAGLVFTLLLLQGLCGRQQRRKVSNHSLAPSALNARARTHARKVCFTHPRAAFSFDLCSGFFKQQVNAVAVLHSLFFPHAFLCYRFYSNTPATHYQNRKSTILTPTFVELFRVSEE